MMFVSIEIPQELPLRGSVFKFAAFQGSPMLNVVLSQYSPGCLSIKEGYKKLASIAEYNPILGAIWSDRVNALPFLQEMSGELHAPLMFEEGIALFDATPTVETVVSVCMPLFSAAQFRLKQDAECSQDFFMRVLPMALNELHATYESILARMVLERLGDSLGRIKEERRADIVTFSHQKVLEVAARSKIIDLAWPCWIRHEARLTQEMYEESEWKGLRDAYADRRIAFE